VRAEGCILTHTQIERETARGRERERERRGGGERERRRSRVRSYVRENREIEREDGGGKEGAGREEEGEWLRLLICIRKTKGVGRTVCPSFRVTKDHGSQSKVFSLDFFLS